MTLKQLQSLKGQTLRVHVAGTLHVDVTVIDAKVAFCKFRLLCAPVAGYGEAWFEPESLWKNGKRLSDVLKEAGE